MKTMLPVLALLGGCAFRPGDPDARLDRWQNVHGEIVRVERMDFETVYVLAQDGWSAEVYWPAAWGFSMWIDTLKAGWPRRIGTPSGDMPEVRKVSLPRGRPSRGPGEEF